MEGKIQAHVFGIYTWFTISFVENNRISQKNLMHYSKLLCGNTKSVCKELMDPSSFSKPICFHPRTNLSGTSATSAIFSLSSILFFQTHCNMTLSICKKNPNFSILKTFQLFSSLPFFLSHAFICQYSVLFGIVWLCWFVRHPISSFWRISCLL